MFGMWWPHYFIIQMDKSFPWFWKYQIKTAASVNKLFVVCLFLFKKKDQQIQIFADYNAWGVNKG